MLQVLITICGAMSCSSSYMQQVCSPARQGGGAIRLDIWLNVMNFAAYRLETHAEHLTLTESIHVHSSSNVAIWQR